MIRLAKLARLGIRTGSVAFGVAGLHADEDWLLSAYHAAECGIRLELCTHSYGKSREFATYREGRMNIVLAMSDEFGRAWLAAHRHCVIEKPRDRNRRVAVFRHYMEGPRLP